MLNNVSLQGRLCADPELKYTQNNIAVLSLRVACDRDFRSDNSNAQTCDFINVVFWRKTAEFVEKYFSKGDMILVQGRIQVRDWTDNDGNKRYTTEIVADRVNFCGGKRDRANTQNEQQRSYEPNVSYTSATNAYATPTGSSEASNNPYGTYEELYDGDGELPF